MADDVLKTRTISASTMNSAALKRFSWTTFEDLIDCLATLHQRMWVITNDLSQARKAWDDSVIQGCEDALKPLRSLSIGNDHHHPNNLTSSVIEAVRHAQDANASVWSRYMEEMEVSICAAAPIVVELEACARLWSKGALPPASTTSEGNGTNHSRGHDHQNLVEVLPTATVVSSSKEDASSPPSAGGGPHQLQIEDSAGFSRSEPSNQSDRATHSPPNIFVRRPSSATLIHPTSFRHETVAAAAAALSRIATGHSPRGEVTSSNDRGVSETRHHIRLVDLDDSISIVAVESERVTPAESQSRSARADPQPSPKVLGLLDHHAFLGVQGPSHDGGGSSAGGSTKTQTHQQHHHRHHQPFADPSPYATRSPSTAGMLGGITASTYIAADKVVDSSLPIPPQNRQVFHPPASCTATGTSSLHTSPPPQSAPPPMGLAAFHQRSDIGTAIGHHTGSSHNYREQQVQSVNTFVAAHSWSPPTLDQRRYLQQQDAQQHHTVASPHPVTPGGYPSSSTELAKHSVLFQHRQTLTSIPSAAELLAQRRQSRR